jgi:hypothetical protein
MKNNNLASIYTLWNGMRTPRLAFRELGIIGNSAYNCELRGVCLMNVIERYPYLLYTNYDEIYKRYNDAWEKARLAAQVLKDSFPWCEIKELTQ